MLQRTKALVATASLMSVLGNFGITLGSAVGAEACRFSTVRLHPTETNKYETYVGKGKNLEIVVTNGTGEPADLFSDPPYRVRNRDGTGECGIDGGNWTTDRLYLSSDDKTLVALELSGSKSTLVIYDTTTCTQKQAFDVSSASWDVTGDAINIGAHYAEESRRVRVPKKTLRLGANCLLK